MSVPDLRFINRKIAIREIARALELTFGADGNIHCWRPELHQNRDRTASVGIRKVNNTVKCFGCGLGPFGPVDLVMSVLGLANPGEAARWIAERFQVPQHAAGRHLVNPPRRICQYGSETEIGVLVRSGLWAQLSRAAHSLVPVFLELAETNPETKSRGVQISYRALARYSGVVSPNAVAAALRELQEIHWLTIASGLREFGPGPVRDTSNYLITPRSDELLELAHANYARFRDDIENERKLRAEARAQRSKAGRRT